MNNQPFYDHDCEFCIFLGSLWWSSLHDLYFHNEPGNMFVMERHGHDVTQFTAHYIDRGEPISAPLLAAYLIAKEAGLSKDIEKGLKEIHHG